MVSSGGEALAPIAYVVEVASLTPIDPADVELSAPGDALAVGETIALTAVVVPGWADDLTVIYESSDPAVASVDPSGVVTARSPGAATITAAAVNGRSDRLAITVSAP
ncbi:MAG: hypothetical protein GX558_11825 [Clostridiales bacterium]|nr:hypothetical protein [Clostridiales bacterium]